MFKRLCLAVHVSKKENRDGCCFRTLDRREGLSALPRQVLRAASRQAEITLGRKSLDRDYTFQDGLWFCSSRLAKEGPVDSVDVDGALFFDTISFRKVVPLVWCSHPSLRLTSHPSTTTSWTILAWNPPREKLC